MWLNFECALNMGHPTKFYKGIPWKEEKKGKGGEKQRKKKKLT